MMLYVYRVNDHEYGAGFGYEGCKRLGDIVEQWPMYTPEQAKFVAQHGTAYWKATDKVSKLAELAYELLRADPTFLENTEKVSVVRVEVEKPRRSWFRWFKTAGETP